MIYNLAIKTLLPYLIGLLAVSGVIWFIYDSGHDRGVKKTELKYQIAIEDERLRIDVANQVALKDARQIELKLIEELYRRDEIIRNLSIEANEDPDANNRSLNNNSVRRINQVR